MGIDVFRNPENAQLFLKMHNTVFVDVWHRSVVLSASALLEEVEVDTVGYGLAFAFALAFPFAFAFAGPLLAFVEVLQRFGVFHFPFAGSSRRRR